MKNKNLHAIAILKNDHETVTKLFKQFKSASNVNNTDKKSGIVEKITAALEAHAALEEEIFYPAVKKARAEETKDEVREAYEEHRQIKALLAALSETDPDDKSFDAKVKVLQEDVEHHVKEEEGEMFPDAREFLGKERVKSLGDQIVERKQQMGEGPSAENRDLHSMQ